jgi:hypothetical protein
LGCHLHPVANRGEITHVFALFKAAAQMAGKDAAFCLDGKKT